MTEIILIQTAPTQNSLVLQPKIWITIARMVEIKKMSLMVRKSPTVSAVENVKIGIVSNGIIHRNIPIAIPKMIAPINMINVIGRINVTKKISVVLRRNAKNATKVAPLVQRGHLG